MEVRSVHDGCWRLLHLKTNLGRPAYSSFGVFFCGEPETCVTHLRTLDSLLVVTGGSPERSRRDQSTEAASGPTTLHMKAEA
jgi:hypothetical protein